MKSQNIQYDERVIKSHYDHVLNGGDEKLFITVGDVLNEAITGYISQGENTGDLSLSFRITKVSVNITGPNGIGKHRFTFYSGRNGFANFSSASSTSSYDLENNLLGMFNLYTRDTSGTETAIIGPIPMDTQLVGYIDSNDFTFYVRVDYQIIRDSVTMGS